MPYIRIWNLYINSILLIFLK